MVVTTTLDALLGSIEAKLDREEAPEPERPPEVAVVMLPVAALAGLMAVTSYVVGLEHHESVQRCDRGEGEACYDVYIDYRLGVSVAEDDQRALDYARRACGLGHAEACFDLGEALWWGWDVVEDPEQAEVLRLRACELGHEEACSPFEL